MDCRQVDRLLEANLDGRLSGFERVALRQHVRGCRACRAKVEAMTAFAERVERTLAAADGPDWSRLTPPPGATPERVAEPAPAPRLRRRTRGAAAAAPVPRDRPPGPRWAVVLVGAAIMAMLVPLWVRSPAPPARAPWLEEAVAAEATRLAAGGGIDLRTGDLDEALAWLGARGLPDLPRIALPADVRLEGAFLTRYGAARTGGLALVTEDGPAALHLRPPSAPAGAAHTARGQGLEARSGRIGDWQAAVVAPSDTVTLSTLDRWLAAAGSAARSGAEPAAQPAAGAAAEPAPF